MPQRAKKAFIFFLIAYFGVSILETLLAAAVPGTPQPAAAGTRITPSPDYTDVIPWYPLLHLPVWVVFSLLYLKDTNSRRRTGEALRLGIFWTVLSIFSDFIFHALLPTPARVNWRELYIGYQPWLLLVYLVIFLSPLAVGFITREPAEQPEGESRAGDAENKTARKKMQETE